MPTPSGLVTKQELIDAQLDTAHLGRVVNSKDAAGNPISQSTNRTGGVNKTLNALQQEYQEAIQSAGGVSLGVWSSGVTEFNAYNEYAVYNGIPYKPRASTTLPYTAQGTDPTSAPDNSFVQPYVEVVPSDLVETSKLSEERIVQGSIFEGSNGNYVRVGDQIPSGTDHVWVLESGFGVALYALTPALSGIIDSISADGLTVDGEFSRLESVKASFQIDNRLSDSFTTKVGTNKSGRLPVVNIVGDSISFGVGVGAGVSVEDHSYAGMMRKLLNLELGSTNLGFTPIVPSNEKKIHEFTRIPSSGAWTAVEKENATHVVNGLSYTSSTVGSQIKITVPTINRTCSIWYTAQPGGGTFTVSVNGVLERTVDSSAGGAVSTKQGFFFEKNIPMTDDGYGKCEIVIEVVSGPVEIVGIDYRDSVDSFRVNNFSQPGRKARDLSPEVISEITKVGSTLVFALGYNDLDATGPDLDTAVANIKAVADSCVARDIKLFILDTGWNYPQSNPIREAWRLMHARVKNSVLLNFAEFFLPSGDIQTASYLQSTIGFLSDGSHPSISGHKNIAEALSSAMSLGYSSKRQSVQFNQKWNPVDILPASGFKNRFSQPLGSTDESSRYVAAWRRNGNSIQIKAWLRHDSTIPVDTWIDLFEIPDNDVTIPFSTQSAILERASGSVPDSTKIGYLRVGSGSSPMVSIKVPTGYTGNTDVVFMAEVPLNFWDDFDGYR